MVELIFISSSRMKFAHIEYLLKETDYYITAQRNYGIGYVEPRIYDRKKLLEESYRDARERFEKNVSNFDDKFFILEDTSVIIDALSKQGEEVPGLDIKYWMQENDFESVDTMLKAKGNNRKCTVRSDILLHLPKSLRDDLERDYVVFTGFSHGYISQKDYQFKTSPLYPWLDNKTFNKWFVPEAFYDMDTPISMLPIDLALEYDFRKEAIDQMKVFLDALDLQMYHDKRKQHFQPTLFDSPAFLLLGSTCAGKSTLAQYLADKYNYFHVEASDFMYLEYHRRHGVGSSVAIGDFAELALRENPEIVAEKVVRFCRDIAAPIVVSGFRTPIEVEYFIKNFKRKTEVLFIDTEQTKRFERCKLRKRADAAYTLENFIVKDAQQYAMGIEELERSVKNKLSNNGTKENYYDRFEEKYGYSLHFFANRGKFKLEELILWVLLINEGEYFTTTQIAQLINNEFSLTAPKNKNNVSRYFNQQFHAYYDIRQTPENSINTYAINDTGKSYIQYIMGMKVKK